MMNVRIHHQCPSRRNGKEIIKYSDGGFFIAVKQLYPFNYRSTIKELLTVNE